MNERIKELMDQARNETTKGISFDTGLSSYSKRFSELIVKECLEACSRANEIRHFVPPTQQQVVLSCMDEIERTFRCQS